MKTNICAALAAAVVLLSPPSVVLAQTTAGRGPMGRGMAMHYDVAAETTLSGTVEDVKSMASPRNGAGGLHLIVRTDNGTQEVAVGPAWFVTSKHFEFAKGDAVTVTGARTTVAGTAIVIAREVKKGEQVLTLRDAKGIPLWMRGMRRPS